MTTTFLFTYLLFISHNSEYEYFKNFIIRIFYFYRFIRMDSIVIPISITFQVIPEDIVKMTSTSVVQDLAKTEVFALMV